MEELKQRLMRLFLSRRFMVFASVLPTIITLRVKTFISESIFSNILIWLMVLILTSNAIDKFKDKLPDFKK